ncbi:lipase family protein [Streptomyces coryli]|uniref:lipase family protein n=1 Tax=Streptomyces coryli TaxID=1128680 RepID=UPI0030B8C6A9
MKHRTPLRKRLTVGLAAAALLGAGLSVPALTAGADEPRAAASCGATDAQIYTPPGSAPASPGTVIACRETKLPEVPGNIPMKAWKVQYSSSDNQGKPVAVSGTVAVPEKTWTGGGPRPVIAFNPGTLGLGPQCAFSKQLAGAYQDMYEGDNIAAALKAGYAVAATDGAGYLNGQTHPYVSGLDAGHALLDIARAAPGVPGSGLGKDAQVGLWGYSEGGQASLWAAQLAGKYAPELKVAGVASGGVPGDLKVVAKGLNGGPFAGFAADAVIGLAASHPAMPFDELMNDQGKEAIKKAKSLCLAGTIAQFAFNKIDNFTKDKLTLDQLYALKGTDGKTWGQVVDEQKLGVGIGPAGSGATHRIAFPTFQYRGLLEEVIPIETEDATRQAYCKAGIPVKWKTYAGEHLTTDNMASGDAVAFFGSRFQGKQPENNC